MKKLIFFVLLLLPFLSEGQVTNFVMPNDFGLPTYTYPFTRYWLRGSVPAGTNPVMDIHGRYRFTFYSDTLEFTTLYARLNASPQRIVTIGSDGTLSSYDPNFLTSQTQADWNASSGVSFIQNKPTLNVSNWNTAYSWGDWRLEVFLHTADTANHWLNNTYIPTWTSITGKPTFFSGEYDSLLNKPVIPTNTNQLTNGAGFLISETDPLFDTKLATKTTSNLTEGSNLYYTASRFNTAFSVKTTSDLTEGTNLYWTGARFTAALTNSAINAALTSIPWSKVSTTPTTLSGYGITDGATTTALTTGLAGKENTITAGTTGQYWRGDKTWQTLTIPTQFNPTGGTGISVSGTYPNNTITNIAPDQTVVLTGGSNTSVSGTYPNFTISEILTTKIYKSSGQVTQALKIWSDIVTPSTSNGYSIDISSAGFTTVLSANVVAIRNTSSAATSPNVSIKTMSTTSITVNVVEDNSATVSILGIGVLSGLPSVFANVTGLTLSVMVIGY